MEKQIECLAGKNILVVANPELDVALVAVSGTMERQVTAGLNIEMLRQLRDTIDDAISGIEKRNPHA